MLNKKNAFTMAELVVAMGIIGVMAAMIIPSMKGFLPDKNKAMLKKAVNITERIVYELYNDEELYPRIGKDGVKEYIGFDNTERVVYMGNSYEGNTKFCKLFMRKLSTKADPDLTSSCGQTPANTDNTVAPTFTTSDGMTWYLPSSTFYQNPNSTPNHYYIYVDVNGSKEPNCKIGYCKAGKDADIFRIGITPYGDIDLYTNTVWEQDNMLKNDTLFKQ